MSDEQHNSVEELESPDAGVAGGAISRPEEGAAEGAPASELSAAASDQAAASDPSEHEAADNGPDALGEQSVASQAAEAASDVPSESAEQGIENDSAEEEEIAEVESAGPVELVEEQEDEISMDWYILKVQSNRERTIADALRRKIAIEGLDELFGDVIVPTEKVTEFKGGKKKVVERKLYPGYIVVHMHINDDTWFAVRETAGIGDFTGSGGKPTPMLPHEVARIIQTDEEETDETPKLDIKFKPGDAVKVKEGTFEGFEGEVNEIDSQSGKVKVLINIFGRSTPVELEYWQVESA